MSSDELDGPARLAAHGHLQAADAVTAHRPLAGGDLHAVEDAARQLLLTAADEGVVSPDVYLMGHSLAGARPVGHALGDQLREALHGHNLVRDSRSLQAGVRLDVPPLPDWL